MALIRALSPAQKPRASLSLPRYKQQCDLLGAHTLTLAHLLRPMKLQATVGQHGGLWACVLPTSLVTHSDRKSVV